MSNGSHNRALAIWLLICCAVVFAMIVLGGVTRLTQSGLSMVEWQPIVGVVPPLSEADWQQAFEKYQQFPEYQKVNRGMSLQQFKSIFWVEYAHRILGRAIGLVFLVPFLVFWLSKRIDRSLSPKLIVVFCLGGLQGLLGWYMVKSGLIDQPHVSQYRLTAHLLLALVIYGYMLWLALDLLNGRGSDGEPSSNVLRRFSVLVMGVVVLMIVSGGFVAGTKAGYAFNTFPTMNGRWVPEGIWALQPGWRNLFENIATVQFIHRVIAAALVVLIPVLWLSLLRGDVSQRVRAGAHGLLIALCVQIALGIATLVGVVPVTIAAAHQAGALLVLTLCVWVVHGVSRKARAEPGLTASHVAGHSMATGRRM